MVDEQAHDAEVVVGLCRASHARLLERIRDLDPAAPQRASLLPGWTIGHVLTHLARNADGHSLRLEGALRGDDVPRYPGGRAQRDADIDAGAARPLGELVDDVEASARRLEGIWARCIEAGWPHRELLADDTWPVIESPFRRLREVEVHHVDLDAGYTPEDWPEAYVERELPAVLEGLPARLDPDGSRRLLAWLIGRRGDPGGVELEPWA